MEPKHDGLIAESLDLIAPGMPLRDAIDSIRSAHTGVLLVIGDIDHVEPICDGGFRLDSPFEAERLFELSKMDGAIILDGDCRTILRANVHLVPDPTLSTSETGIRHRTAERVSRQTDALVIAVSERRVTVAIYRGGEKLVLEELETVLAKANQALQTLQRYRNSLDEVSAHLTSLEFEGAVTLNAVVTAVQRFVVAIHVSNEIGRYILELGTEGRLVRMQADELMVSVEDDYHMLLRDYSYEVGPRKATAIRTHISELSQEQLLDDLVVTQALGYPPSVNALENHVSSRGYRLLNKVPLLPGPIVNRIVERFGNVTAVVAASEAELDEVDGVGARRAKAIKEGLQRIKEHGGL